MSKWVEMSYFFNGGKLSLGSGWSHVKRIWACEHGKPPKWGVCMYYRYSFVHFFKILGRFSQLQNRFIKNNRTQSAFMLQRWLAYKNIAERIRNRKSALYFSFSALFFCNIDLKSNNIRKITDFSFFLL